MRATPRRRRTLGATLSEMVTAASCMVILLAVAYPVFRTAGDVGDEGSAKISAQAENRRGLVRLARELENTSTTALDPFGNRRLRIDDGDVPEPLADLRAGFEDLGGFRGTLGTRLDDTNDNEDDDSAADCDDDRGELDPGDAKESKSRGTGKRGGGILGRVRDGSFKGTTEFGDAAVRPRHAVIPVNSVLTFQKVTGYSIGADGAPVVEWGAPIEYRVVRNRLVRTQSGVAEVVANHCTGFSVDLTDAGTVTVTVVSQKRASATSRVLAEVNQVEVSPKN